MRLWHASLYTGHDINQRMSVDASCIIFQLKFFNAIGLTPHPCFTVFSSKQHGVFVGSILVVFKYYCNIAPWAWGTYSMFVIRYGGIIITFPLLIQLDTKKALLSHVAFLGIAGSIGSGSNRD